MGIMKELYINDNPNYDDNYKRESIEYLMEQDHYDEIQPEKF